MPRYAIASSRVAGGQASSRARGESRASSQSSSAKSASVVMTHGTIMALTPRIVASEGSLGQPVHELTNARIGRAPGLVRRAIEDELPLVHHADPVGNREQAIEVARDHDDGRS